MSDSLDAITAIVKRRYETGEYGSAHFRLTQPVWEQMRQHAPPVEPSIPALPRGPLGDLLSIPIVIDDQLPEGIWRLVDTMTGAIIHEGTADG